MSEPDPQRLHQLYGAARKRIVFNDADFSDYLLMCAVCAAVGWWAYAPAPPLQWAAVVLSGFMAATFPLRHGMAWRVPVVLRAPQELAYTLLYKLRNLNPVYPLGLALFAADQLFIRLTPDWPHHSAQVGEVALWLFYAHAGLVTAYRTVILVAHLRRRERVREFLMQTTWKRTLLRQPSIVLQILHAYVTGLLAHLILLAPWYVVITHFSFSLLSLLPMSVANVLLHVRYLQLYSKWFYRDHWLAHNSEVDFIYLHGSHHDALPCALIGVSGNGFLEGLARNTVGSTVATYSPLVAFVFHTIEVTQDMRMHQYIPGIYPRLTRQFHEVAQHSTHHFGRLEPYGIGLRTRTPPAEDSRRGWLRFPPVEILNSIDLDEKLNGFQWDNPRYRQFMDLYDHYQQQP